MTKRVIQLLRVSTAAQAAHDRVSLPTQRAINQRTAEMYGLTIVRTIEMSDVSGAMILLAPEMQQLITMMHDSEIHGVVAREFSRLMRPENLADFGLLQTFAETNTILYLPEGPIDFATDDGRMLGGMKALMSGRERTDLKKRIWQIKEEKRRKGELGQSKIVLPFGVDYNYETQQWSYTPDAQRVKEAYRLFLTGLTNYREIARRVAMSPRTVGNVLRNPIYKGWRIIDEKRDSSWRVSPNGRQFDRKKVKRAPEDVIRVQVFTEPLVSEDEFNQAQRIIQLKEKNHWCMNESTEHRFVYNGFLRCECEAVLWTLPQPRYADYYLCSKKCGSKYQRRDVLDPHLDNVFSKRLTSPSFLKRHVIPAVTKKRRPDNGAAQAQRQLEALDSKRKRILDAYFEGVISSAERDERVSLIDRERKAFETIARRQQPEKGLTLEMLVDAFAPFVEFDLLNRDDKRALLTIITPEITVANYEVKGMFIAGVGSHTGMEAHASTRFWIPLSLKAA